MVTIKGKSYNIVVRCLGVSFEPLSRKESGSVRYGGKELLLTEEGQQTRLPSAHGMMAQQDEWVSEWD